MTLITSRRSFITGMTALMTAPAIVRVSSLMPIKVFDPHLTEIELLKQRLDEAYTITRQNMITFLYSNPDTTPTLYSGFQSLVPAEAWRHKEITTSFIAEHSPR